MNRLKYFLLLFVSCVFFGGCTVSSPSTNFALTVTRSASGTAVITAYPYFSDYTVAPYWDEASGWTFSDFNDTSLIDESYPTIADLCTAYNTEDSAPILNHTAPSDAEIFWPNPTGDGVYVLVNDKIRLYNQWGNEQPTRALVRLVLESRNDTYTLNVIDQDGKTILQLTSSCQDPLYSDSDLCLDGDWFYWRTDDGTVIPYQITVE